MIQYLGQPNGQQQIQQIPYVEAKKKYKNSIADKRKCLLGAMSAFTPTPFVLVTF